MIGAGGCPPRDATAELARLLAGELSPAALLDEYLHRLRGSQQRHNGAVEILEAEARAIAASPLAGPLAGLPHSLKESFAVAGREITLGSLRMPPMACREDAAVLQRLRRAGAVLLARGNVPELAMIGETDGPRFGRTCHPEDPALTCGGSSGGDAALVATGAVAFGVGSDILGSIRIPAAFCGIVGMRAASTAIERAGIAPRFDGETDCWFAAGPITRTVRDARLVYEVLSGASLPEPRTAGGRLWLPDALPLEILDAPIGEALGAARACLLEAGLTAVPQPIGDFRQVYHDVGTLLALEVAPQLAACLTDAGGRRFSLPCEWIRRLAGRPQIYGGLLQMLTVGSLLRVSPRRLSVSAPRLRGARSVVHARLGDDGLLLLPTLGLLAPPHGAMNRRSLRPGYNGVMAPTVFCNAMDLPAITVPAPAFREPGAVRVPGVMLACAPGAEARLFDAALLLETRLAGTNSERDLAR
jgi:Asp-tRNA(Asn)/Glu-tRNA(Gln) amidotransferase A subunit family amidase